MNDLRRREWYNDYLTCARRCSTFDREFDR
jgi:hypothetical protein